MSTKTSNYNFIKPALTDAADITVTNENWDKIDTNLKSLNDQTGLFMRGWNPIDNVSKDTPSYWKNIGNGYWLIDYPNVFIGQPRQWGFLINMVQGEEVAQTFIVQASGETYRRNANGLGWYGNDWREGTWTKVHDAGDNLMSKAGGRFTGVVLSSGLASAESEAIRGIGVKDSSNNYVSTNRILGVRK